MAIKEFAISCVIRSPGESGEERFSAARSSQPSTGKCCLLLERAKEWLRVLRNAVFIVTVLIVTGNTE